MVVGLNGRLLAPVQFSVEEDTNCIGGLATTLFLRMAVGIALERIQRKEFVVLPPVQVCHGSL